MKRAALLRGIEKSLVIATKMGFSTASCLVITDRGTCHSEVLFAAPGDKFLISSEHLKTVHALQSSTATSAHHSKGPHLAEGAKEERRAFVEVPKYHAKTVLYAAPHHREILESSILGGAPLCSHHRTCPKCPWQHLKRTLPLKMIHAEEICSKHHSSACVLQWRRPISMEDDGAPLQQAWMDHVGIQCIRDTWQVDFGVPTREGYLVPVPLCPLRTSLFRAVEDLVEAWVLRLPMVARSAFASWSTWQSRSGAHMLIRLVAGRADLSEQSESWEHWQQWLHDSVMKRYPSLQVLEVQLPADPSLAAYGVTSTPPRLTQMKEQLEVDVPRSWVDANSTDIKVPLVKRKDRLVATIEYRFSFRWARRMPRYRAAIDALLTAILSVVDDVDPQFVSHKLHHVMGERSEKHDTPFFADVFESLCRTTWGNYVSSKDVNIGFVHDIFPSSVRYRFFRHAPHGIIVCVTRGSLEQLMELMTEMTDLEKPFRELSAVVVDTDPRSEEFSTLVFW